jgi:hypothetical protein
MTRNAESLTTSIEAYHHSAAEQQAYYTSQSTTLDPNLDPALVSSSSNDRVNASTNGSGDVDGVSGDDERWTAIPAEIFSDWPWELRG